MNIAKVLLKEIGHRKTNFALSLAAITTAATLFVAGPTLIDTYRRQTNAQMDKMEQEATKIMREMGFNLMVVHRDTDMTDFWASDFSSVDMPQDYVDKLAGARGITLVTHIVATLQQKVEWNGRKVLLVGYLAETPQAHLRKKAPMGYDPEAGTVILGFELGHGLKEGESVDILGKSFRIAQILREQGSKEDITIAMTLADAQGLLNKKDRINQILALGCRCAEERLPQVRAQLGEVLPDTKITEFRSIALARAEQRDSVAEHAAEVQGRMGTLISIVTPLVVLACAVWVGLLAMSNVRERRSEIGLFRSLGIGSVKIGVLFLGKAVLLGVLGGAIGFFAGTWLGQMISVRQFAVSADQLKPAYDILVLTILGAPLLSALASYLPTLLAVVQDPAVVLREQ
jgi:ABC-type lipoprotein release transport system permease subunit